jgi:hypothetical protein
MEVIQVGRNIPDPVLNMNTAILDPKSEYYHILCYTIYICIFMDMYDDDKNYINPQESGVDYSIERVGLLAHK